MNPMNEKFNKNAKVEQLTNMFLSRREEKALSLKILLQTLSRQGIHELYVKQQLFVSCRQYSAFTCGLYHTCVW